GVWGGGGGGGGGGVRPIDRLVRGAAGDGTGKPVGVTRPARRAGLLSNTRMAARTGAGSVGQAVTNRAGSGSREQGSCRKRAGWCAASWGSPALSVEIRRRIESAWSKEKPLPRQVIGRVPG